MPNIKSAKKRLKQNEVQRLRNTARKSLVRTTRRAFQEAVSGGDLDASQKSYTAYCSALDKAAKDNSIAKNNATRNKARAADKLRAMAS